MSNLPPAGHYEIDPTHSAVDFVVRHLVAAKVRGGFKTFGGTIVVGETPETSSVTVEIDVASIDTGVDDRDAHLRSADFFDVENQPTATFTSTSITPAGDDAYTVSGDLTIAGVTRTVALELDYAGSVTDPWGNSRIVFSATAEINREDFGLTWNQVLESGGLMISKNAKIEIEIEAVHKVDATV